MYYKFISHSIVSLINFFNKIIEYIKKNFNFATVN